MSPKREKKNTALLLAGAAGLGALYLWSQPRTAAAVDPRWLAQQELARRQAAGSPTAGTDTLGMILKLGGSAATLGTTVYGIFKKVFDTGTNADALTTLSKYISDGPTGLVPTNVPSDVLPDLTVDELITSWETVPPTTPGTSAPIDYGTEQIVSIPEGEVAIPYEIGTEPVEAVQTVPSLEPTGLSAPPTIEPGLTDFPLNLKMPGTLFDPSAFESSTGAMLLQQDGIVKLSLTTEELDQASNLVNLWESGQLDLSLLPTDQATFIQENMPMLKKFTESGDFGVGKFTSPITGDAVMHALPADFPTELIQEPVPASTLQSFLDTPLWERGPVELGAGTVAPEAGALGNYVTLGEVLQVVGTVATIVAACVSAYFTITGNLPDYQKAIYCALDAASIAALFIPVVGWIVGLAIQIVKFVLQKVLGQDKSHEQREAEETAVLLQKAQGLGQEIAQQHTLKTLYTTLASYASGSIGGYHDIAIVTWVMDPQGQQLMLGLTPGIYRVATISEWVQYIDTFGVSIQGGVKPENLAAANASLRDITKQLVALMVNARTGDYNATMYLVNRAFKFWIPGGPKGLSDWDARDVLASITAHPEMTSEYPVWREVVEQTAFSLQADVWGFTTWADMIAATTELNPATATALDLRTFAQAHGFPSYTAFRRAFFDFAEPISQALLNGPTGAARRMKMQADLDALVIASHQHVHHAYNDPWGGRITGASTTDPTAIQYGQYAESVGQQTAQLYESYISL